MPILIKDYTWKQTDKKIIIKVPFKGTDTSKADIFTCDNFIKVHCPPFLFEVCLRDIINDENSLCRIARNEIIFELHKREEGSWDVLEAPLTKTEVLEVKQRAIEISHERTKAKIEAMTAKKQEIKTTAVREQIALDTKEREKIDAFKENEKKIAMNELEIWKQNQIEQSRSENSSMHEATQKENKKIVNSSILSKGNQESDSETSSEEETNEEMKENRPPSMLPLRYVDTSKRIFDEPQENSLENVDSEKFPLKPGKNNNRQNNKSEIPLPRNSCRIGVSFTAREFPTPSRESKLQEENEWLQKQAEARRRAGFVIEDLRPEEHDPIWLKDKGDSFYSVNNYIGAISAYSHGIKLNPKNPALYSNRAAAHLAMGNLRRVIQDTTMALELLVPCIEMNASSRSLCHARRGAALCKLNMLKPGLADLEKALKLCPGNKGLEEDIKLVKEKLENPDYISEEEEEGEEINNEINID